LIYSAPEFFVLRTPLFHFDQIFVDDVQSILNDASLREAIFISSPELDNEIEKLFRNEVREKDKEKLFVSIVRYWLRACYRPTPFGLFAGVSIGKFSVENRIELVSLNSYRKNTRPDSHFLSSYAQKVLSDTSVRESVKWYVNNTIYSVLDKLRYIRYQIDKDNRSHQLSSASISTYLITVLENAKKGATITELASSLVTEEISLEEAKEFVNEVISERLLLSDLEPKVTGEQYHEQLARKLADLAFAPGYIERLRRISEGIRIADENSIGSAKHLYKSVIDEIKFCDVPFEPGKLLQCDLYKPIEVSTLSLEIAKELSQAIEFLNLIGSRPEQTNLEKFKEEFIRRYDSREVSLLEVLDPETGIGYPPGQQSASDYSPLIENIQIQSENGPKIGIWNNTDWTELVVSKLESAIRNSSVEIEFTDRDLENIFASKESSDSNSLPNSAYTLCSVYASKVDNSDFSIYHNVTSGPSAANLLGRFCFLDEELTSQVKDLMDKEAAFNPDAVIAEILHIPNARLGNILMRPILRDFEIPVLTATGVDSEHTILLSDLVLSVKGDRVLLQSKKLNKEILPRLATAHNFALNPIPHYHFLCDLQFQGVKGVLSWDWGIFNYFPFLPRVRYGKTILSKARWNIKINEFSNNASADATQLSSLLPQYFKAKKIPPMVTIFDGDNQLPIDINNEFCRKILAQDIIKQKSLFIHECLFNETNLFVKDNSGFFTNEVIVPWYKTNPNLPIVSPTNSQHSGTVQRVFSLGDHWLYVKMYCGVKTADSILTQVIHPLVERLLGENSISKFFFIRYADPENHLRLRFLSINPITWNIMVALNEALEPYISSNLVWKVQVDTYVRELERYGRSNMENSETLFFHDSMACIGVLSMLEGDQGDELRWKFALKGVDDLLDIFGLNTSEKMNFISTVANQFLKEFNSDNSEFKAQLSSKYRHLKPGMTLIFSDIDESFDFYPAWEIFHDRIVKIKACADHISNLLSSNDLEIFTLDLLSSYIHMFLNRFLRSKHRLQEMIIYDLLRQHYKSVAAREKRK